MFLVLFSEKYKDFKFDNFYSRVYQNYLEGKNDAGKVLKEKIKLRNEVPFFIYYDAIPLFIFPELFDNLLKEHLNYLSEVSIYDNTVNGLTPMILAPWFFHNKNP